MYGWIAIAITLARSWPSRYSRSKVSMQRWVKAGFVVLHEHHRDVVELDRIGQRDERPVGGGDLGRLVVIDPVADIFDAGRGQEFGGVLCLGQPGAEPADRLLAGAAFDDGKRALNHRLL